MTRLDSLPQFACLMLTALFLTSSAAGQTVDAPTTAEVSDGGLIRALKPAPLDELAVEPEAEIIRERYADGKVKIERYVIQDAQGNYVNHGSWKLYDRAGNLVVEGVHHLGKKQGQWKRFVWTRDAELLSSLPHNQFQQPFVSAASFQDGKLHGKWTISDAKQRKASEWEFADGARHGESSWWFANGETMRRAVYQKGDLHGQYLQWSLDGKQLVDDTYEQGHKLAPMIAYHEGANRKKSEGIYLFAKLVKQTDDDWWNTRPATFAADGKEMKHGPWVSWHSNGQMESQGRFDRDQPVGKFTWWHTNGQKSIEGSYADGKQSGAWLWWHANGQKSIQGAYHQGNPSGPWHWWTADGKLVQRADFSEAQSIVKQRDNADAPRQAELPELVPSNGGSSRR